MCSSGHTHRAVIALRHYRRELRLLCGQSEYFCEPVPLRVDIIRLCDNCQESCARLAALAMFWFSDKPVDAADQKDAPKIANPTPQTRRHCGSHGRLFRSQLSRYLSVRRHAKRCLSN